MCGLTFPRNIAFLRVHLGPSLLPLPPPRSSQPPGAAFPLSKSPMSPSPLPLASCRPLIAAEARLPPQAILLNQPQRERRAAARWFNVANTVLPAVALLLPVPTRTLLFTLAQILYFILFVCCWLFDFTAHLHRFAPRCPHASRFCATPPLPFSGYLLLTL